MDDLGSIVDSWFGPNERHFGEPPKPKQPGRPRRPRVKKQTGNTLSSASAAAIAKEAMKDFHAYAGGPRSADGLSYCRGYAERAAAQAGNPGDPIDFTASTPGVKRDGLDLRGNGWRLDNFHRSPVFQWCHDKTMPPLGRVDAKAGDTLQARVFFDQEDDLARRVESKYRRGFLHAVSVGWDFVDGHGTRLNTGRLSLDEIRDRAFYDLTELSGVPVPADPDALMARQRSGLRTLGRQLVSIFDEQEHGTALAEEVARALEDELERLGLTIPLIQQAARHLPARKAGFFMPKTTGPADTGISQDAARTFLAAFSFQGAS